MAIFGARNTRFAAANAKIYAQYVSSDRRRKAREPAKYISVEICEELFIWFRRFVL